MAQKKRIEKEELSYSNALAELESIVEQMADGNVNIDELAKSVKRGKELVKLCQDRLRETEDEVNKVLKEE